jgi:hypothetical protein
MSNSETVLALIAAIVDSRTNDALLLVDPIVTWRPIARPGLSLYQNHSGIIRLIDDLHKAYGQFRVEIKKTIVLSDTMVKIRAQAIRETPEGDILIPISDSIFTLRNGLVTDMEAHTVAD